MDFSPDESIRTLLRSASERQPKVDGGTLSRRAEQRVRRSGVICNISFTKSYADSTEGQTSEIEGEASEDQGEEGDRQGEESCQGSRNGGHATTRRY